MTAQTTLPTAPSDAPAFTPVSCIPDVPMTERAVLAFWEQRGAFGTLRRLHSDNPGGLTFRDGLLTANHPMGVRHAWGRTY